MVSVIILPLVVLLLLALFLRGLFRTVMLVMLFPMVMALLGHSLILSTTTN